LSRLVRKNLMVDADALSELAGKLGTSESEAVRQSVRSALGAQEMIAALGSPLVERVRGFRNAVPESRARPALKREKPATD